MFYKLIVLFLICILGLFSFPVTGCYYHFCQSLWRKIQELGLSVAYRRDYHVKKFCRKLMTLAYIPLALVRLNFRLIFASNTIRRMIRQYPAIATFIQYFQATYIDGIFKPRLWNVYDRDMDFRTNNHVEGFCFTMFIFNIYGSRHSNFLTDRNK